MSETVELQVKRRKPFEWRAPGHREADLTRSLPFFQSGIGRYVHRVRFGKMYYRDGKLSHTAFTGWCGVTGFVSEKNRAQPWRDRGRNSDLFVDPPKSAVLCATCEGRAIGAGQTESRMICGRVVKFSPRP